MLVEDVTSHKVYVFIVQILLLHFLVNRAPLRGAPLPFGRVDDLVHLPDYLLLLEVAEVFSTGQLGRVGGFGVPQFGKIYSFEEGVLLYLLGSSGAQSCLRVGVHQSAN